MHMPSGNRSTGSSGVSVNARCEPAVPFCPPAGRFWLPPPRRLLSFGTGRPGSPSFDRGIDEFALFRESRCSTRANRAANSS